MGIEWSNGTYILFKSRTSGYLIYKRT
ncbi:hypothetical protein ACFW04_010974 [Cataglyphis niger]